MNLLIKLAFAFLAFLGAIGAFSLGSKWKSDLSEADSLTQLVAATKIQAVSQASTLLILCSLLGITAALLVLLGKWKKNILCIALILAGIAPLLFSDKALFGVPMTLAGILGFAIKPKKVLQLTSR